MAGLVGEGRSGGGGGGRGRGGVEGVVGVLWGWDGGDDAGTMRGRGGDGRRGRGAAGEDPKVTKVRGLCVIGDSGIRGLGCTGVKVRGLHTDT